MSPTPDDLSRRLDQATPTPDPNQVDAALRQVHRRVERSGSPRRAWVVAGAAAAAPVVVVALVGLAGRGDAGTDGVRAGPGTSGVPASSDGEATPAIDADGWPEGWRQPPDGGRIELRLRADGWPLAQEIDRTLGPELTARTIDITVGGRSFPTGAPTGDPSGPPECPARLQEMPQLDAGTAPVLEASIELDTAEVRSGADVTRRVIITAPRQKVTYTTGPTQVGLVVDRGTDVVVATWTGGMECIGLVVEVGRESTTLDLVAGTERCDPDGPPGLPPGDYDVVWGVAPCVLSDPACPFTADLSSSEPLVVLTRAPLTVTGWER